MYTFFILQIHHSWIIFSECILFVCSRPWSIQNVYIIWKGQGVSHRLVYFLYRWWSCSIQKVYTPKWVNGIIWLEYTKSILETSEIARVYSWCILRLYKKYTKAAFDFVRACCDVANDQILFKFRPLNLQRIRSGFKVAQILYLPWQANVMLSSSKYDLWISLSWDLH